MPLNTVKDMQLEEYQDLFKDFFIFNRKNGILEIRMHTDNKEAKWSKELHRALPQIFPIIGADRKNEVIILTGTGAVSYTHLTLPTILLV